MLELLNTDFYLFEALLDKVDCCTDSKNDAEDKGEKLFSTWYAFCMIVIGLEEGTARAVANIRGEVVRFAEIVSCAIMLDAVLAVVSWLAECYVRLICVCVHPRTDDDVICYSAGQYDPDGHLRRRPLEQ